MRVAVAGAPDPEDRDAVAPPEEADAGMNTPLFELAIFEKTC